jgi:translation initiation factor 2D
VKGEEGKLACLQWEKLSSRVTAKMSSGYSLTFKGLPPTVHKGKLELIELTVGSRSGNKKVTLVHNLDVFGIDLQDFSRKCQGSIL